MMNISKTNANTIETPIQTTQTTVVSKSGETFKDAISQIPEVENQVNDNSIVKTDTINPDVQHESSEQNFEFISTTNENFSAKITLTKNDNTETCKNAEKELADEIFLMNESKFVENKIQKDTQKHVTENLKPVLEVKIDDKKDSLISDNKISNGYEKSEIKTNETTGTLANNSELLNIISDIEKDFDISEENFDIKPSIKDTAVADNNVMPVKISTAKDLTKNNVQNKPKLTSTVINKESQKNNFSNKTKIEDTKISNKKVTDKTTSKIDKQDKKQEIKPISLDKNVNPQAELSNTKKIENFVKTNDEFNNKFVELKPEVKEDLNNKVPQTQPENTNVLNIKPLETEVEINEVLNDKTVDISIEENKNILTEEMTTNEFEANSDLNVQKVDLKLESPEVLPQKQIVETFETTTEETTNTITQDYTIEDSPKDVKDVKDIKLEVSPISDKKSSTVLENTNKKVEISKNIIKPITEEVIKNATKNETVISKADKMLEKVIDTTIDTVTEDVIEAKSIDLTQNKPQQDNMQVLKFIIPQSPLAELNKNLTTEKTNDIVKFIDANLSTSDSSKADKNRNTTKTNAVSGMAKKAEAIKMTEADAKFFNNLIEQNTQVNAQNNAQENIKNLKEIEDAKSVQVSKSLLQALKESQENNKSFRVDFDKDLSVILKVNKEGQISAEFLPGDKVVEQYLKQNMSLLKQRFDDEGLEYENLSYRQSKKEDKDEHRKNSRGNNKENGYE